MFWKQAESLRVQLLGWLVLPLLFVLGINALLAAAQARELALFFQLIEDVLHGSSLV